MQKPERMELITVWFTDRNLRYHYFRTIRKRILRKLYPNWGWSNARDSRDISPFVFFKGNKEVLMYVTLGFLAFIGSCAVLVMLYAWLTAMGY